MLRYPSLAFGNRLGIGIRCGNERTLGATLRALLCTLPTKNYTPLLLRGAGMGTMDLKIGVKFLCDWLWRPAAICEVSSHTLLIFDLRVCRLTSMSLMDRSKALQF